MTNVMQDRLQFITSDEVEKALDFLRDSAQQLGDAKARSIKSTHMLKHVEALKAKASNEKAAEARKADARTSPEFVEALTEDAIASGEYEKLRALREAAGAKIEAWRSQQANYRHMKL